MSCRWLPCRWISTLLSPEETAAFIRTEQELWRPVLRKIGAD